jgi:hypothetical protein
MRLILLALVPLTILAACSSEPAEEPVTEEVAEETAEAPAMTAANGSPAGTYEVTAADGTVTTSTLNADGTYEDTAADGSVLAEGTWAVADGKTCFTPTTEGEEAMCYTETAPAADGSFTATPDSGDPVTVRPAVAAVAADEAPVE